MNDKLSNKLSPKHLWLCVVLVAVVLVFALTASSPGFLLFVIPCVLMMGAMMWMMGGMGGGARGGDGE